ncbi:esterase-like activity of phytase family protein [Siccirubricoccus phaeus]|uniref:esterase-like activity of phytase family protein n=1 Tax=Siccirubricoccus phaeus TaxID=2595053 RepID=UPI0011F1C8B5|nr:esterase-like activity of phytase family protein [Siccirubricoccus phaeus]
MRAILLAAGLVAAVSGTARADQRFDATLAGHAILPAATFAQPPADAPPALATSGRFTGPGNLRIEQRGSLPGDTGAVHGRRPTGLSLPFQGQPVQGFSGIKPVAGEAGAYWVLTDNGFGNRRNSADTMLMFHKLRPDFRAGTVAVERTIFLSDPNRVVPFPIVNETSDRRYLTGADFDPESIQPVADGFWIGEEFGPFLIKVDLEGRVQRLVPTKLGEEEIRSPDNPALQLPASPTGTVAFRSQRSGGYEGMALSPDGSRLYALLEKPLFQANGQVEGQFLRILELDTARGEWTGRSLKYRFEPGGVSIGDFNMVDERRALIIERDDGEGDPSLACAGGPNRPAENTPPACFPSPARLKRIYLVDLQATDSEGFVRKIGHIDLMAVRDPEGLGRGHGDRAASVPNDRFTFPFFTIENVAVVDADHIIVGNDNNLPFSAGRRLTAADSNELILLRVPELLRAR